MVIPDFQTLTLPLLRSISDGQEHHGDECIQKLASEFTLSPEEQGQLLPSGSRTTFENRVAWATTYLYKAGLVERTGRKRIRITDRGQRAIQESPLRIDMTYLSQFPEYQAFRQRTDPSPDPSPIDDIAGQSDVTPDEQLASSYRILRQTLSQDLLDRIKQSSPRFFETLVVDLLVSMGYGGTRQDAGQAVGGSGDDGIDGIIKEDKLGLDFVYIQAKRWEGPVGRPVVQAFAGSLEGHRVRKGVFITTSTFTKDALEYVTRIEKRIVLVDGDQLADLMIDYGIGVTDVAVYHVKRVDLDYFGED